MRAVFSVNAITHPCFFSLTTGEPNETYTPLAAAAANGHSHVIRYLMGQGANPKAVSNKGNTALGVAVYHGRFDAAETFLRKDPTLLFPKEGISPLCYLTHTLKEASSSISLKWLELFFKLADPASLLTFRDGKGHGLLSTTLAAEAHKEDFPLSEYLLIKGADPLEIPPSRFFIPDARKDHSFTLGPKITVLLLSYGFDPDGLFNGFALSTSHMQSHSLRTEALALGVSETLAKIMEDTTPLREMHIAGLKRAAGGAGAPA